MNKISYHQLLIDAIVGQGFSGYSDPERMVNIGLAYFSGNQHNEAWSWNMAKLKSLEAGELEKIYLRDRS